MNIAIVGCGYVADYYVKTMPLHPELRLQGVMDRDPERAAKFSKFYSVPTYESLDALLDDDGVDLVINLTNPASHFEVSKAALDAGKHVYTEKPLAPIFEDAKTLVGLAEKRDLHLVSAPCSLLNETAQTLWKALREEVVGPVRLVYAEMDDGMIHQAPYRKWVSESGTPWPYKDEFESGCTLEHAGYVVTWLVGFFGPARSVTAFSSCQIPEKGSEGESLTPDTPDFSVACIQFESGVVARLTCSIIAPRDHAMKFYGDEGTLYTGDIWNDRSPVYVSRSINLGRRTVDLPWGRKIPLAGKHNPQIKYRGAQQRNFCRGLNDIREAIQERRSPRLSSRYCLHVTEIVMAIQNALDTASPHVLESTFDPEDVTPMAYARS